jgi:hypothetical protein
MVTRGKKYFNNGTVLGLIHFIATVISIQLNQPKETIHVI